jgi:glycosyltransferase involved in cell wall biosynthesis
MLKKKQKTIFICPNGFIGGAEKAMIHFCVGHQLNKWPVEILFFSNGDAVKLAKKYGVPTHILPIKFRLSSLINLYRACMYIRNYIKINNYEIIHATMAYSQIISTISTFLLPIKRIWYQHGPVVGVLDKLASRTPVDIICFNSKFLQNLHNSSNYLSPPKHKQSIVPCAIESQKSDSNKVQRIRETFVSPNEKLILLAGRITSWKGYDTAIKALATNNHNWKLLIIGSSFRNSDIEYEKKLHALVIEHNIENKVTFLPFQNDIVNYFAAADVFIHCSNVAEPFGLVVAEAMLQHTFVIGSSKGGITDILQDTTTGFSFDSTSTTEAVSQLATKINQFLSLSNQQILTITQNAFNLISQRHNIIPSTTVLEDLYRGK